jgi:hypothetical protein
MNYKSIILMMLAVLLFFSCSKKSTTAPDATINENLIGYWHLLSYQDEDGLQNYSGFLEIAADREINGQFADEDEVSTYSGTVETTDTIFRANVTETNAHWIEHGKHEFSYTLNGNQLRLEGKLDNEDVIIIYSKDDPNSEEVGDLTGTVKDADDLFDIESALIVIQNTQLSAFSDASGNFFVTDIPVGNYVIQISKSSYENQTAEVSISDSQITTVEVLMNKATSGNGSISGFVADAMNQVMIAGATISILGTGYQTQSAENGFYFFSDIPVGSYDLKCEKTGFETQTSTNQAVISDDEIQVDFILLPEGTVTYGSLSGTVTNSQSGTPIPNVAVQMVGLVNSAISYQDGSYEVLFIPAGIYEVSFTKVGYDTIVHSNVSIENGMESILDCSMNTIEGTSSLAASVTNTVGLPLSGVFIEIIGTDLSGTTGVAGFCSIQNVPAGTYDIRASKAGYVTQVIENVEFLSGIPRPLEIVMQMGK